MRDNHPADNPFFILGAFGYVAALLFFPYVTIPATILLVPVGIAVGDALEKLALKDRLLRNAKECQEDTDGTRYVAIVSPIYKDVKRYWEPVAREADAHLDLKKQSEQEPEKIAKIVRSFQRSTEERYRKAGCTPIYGPHPKGVFTVVAPPLQALQTGKSDGFKNPVGSNGKSIWRDEPSNRP